MSASYKIANFIKPILKIKNERHMIHPFLFIVVLEIVFPGSFFLTMNQNELHMLLVEFAQMRASRGKVVEETWRLKDVRADGNVLYTTRYIDTDEEINSVRSADDVTSIKSYGRTLDGVMEGRWMFWYPGCVAKVVRRNGRKAPYGSDTFMGYCSVTGNPQAVGCFKDGHRNGWWKFYNADGSLDLTATGYYENDILTKRGENPLFVPLIALAMASLLGLNLLLAKVFVWLDVTFKSADPKFSHP